MLVTHRFTPPTCTLEIEAHSSNLSRWKKQQTFKDVQFQLSFDDPRLTESEQVTVKGDRTQLEQLYQAVNSYIQNFLQQSSLEETISFPSVDDREPVEPYLQQQGLVTHNLFLGSLADSNSGNKIYLSTVQLFDLVTALEDYQTEIVAIPNPNATNRKKLPLFPMAVASILVLVGLAALGFNIFKQSSLNWQSASSVQESANSSKRSINQNKQNDVIPPQVATTTEKPVTESKIEDPLSSKEKLPPPPPVEQPKAPPANIPDFSKYPLPEPNQINNIRPKLAKKPKSTPSSRQDAQPELALKTKQENISIPDVDVPPLSQYLLPTEEDILENSVAKADKNNSPERSFQSVETEQSISSPQLKEIKQYFQQQWQPPVELKQTIEYRLVVSPDGAIVRITPIGKASAIFIDRTNIPLMGEAFISPSATKGNQIVRLLLSPDGDVKTFLESK